MSNNKPIVHLFCNAHIDPVWMWGWEEGAREAVSTFRTAVNLLDAYPEFVFNHNESLLYEWVEEYDLPLFERIKEYVQKGRWNITGGWYLQPDVNLLGGETLARVILEGRRYFSEKFGVRPTVSYNFDSFGHPGTLPQLLKQSGFALYVHCRPQNFEIELPNPTYRWEGVDGTQVLAVRPSSGWYTTPTEDYGTSLDQARRGIEIARETGEDVLVLWGLGDHGGGATAAELDQFRALIEEMRDSDVEVRHSTPEAYLERIKGNFGKYPVHKGEIQRTLMGTYTSVAPIKREMREGEALLASAERWSAIAWWRYGHPYPAEELRVAWKRLMFNTFHDVLCGSLLEDALPGVHDMYGYAGDVSRRIIARKQNTLLPNIIPTPGTIPVYVFNPHTTPVRSAVGINFLSEYRGPKMPKAFALYDDAGVQIPSQNSGGSSVVLSSGTWQPFMGFTADMPPLTVRRYEIRPEKPDFQPAGELSVEETDSDIVVQNRWWTIRFSRKQAAPVEIIERSTGRNVIKAPVRLYAMADVAHAWGGMTNAVFNQPVSALTALSPAEVGVFTGTENKEGPAVRITAQGAVFVEVECLVGWQHTRAALRFTLYAELPHIDLKTRIYMQARRKMIKLQLPFDLPSTRAICEVPYGTAERPTDATEYPYARWIRLDTEAFSVGVANSGQNGLDVADDGTLNLSITRGGVHCHWDEKPEGLNTSLSFTWMDQTQIDTSFRLVAGADKTAVASQLISAALELNQPLERFFVYYPPSQPANAPEKVASFLTVEPQTVVLGALKKAETEDALIIRLHETIGQDTHAQVTLENDAPRSIQFRAHEIKTFKVTRQAAGVSWQETNILEEA
jgi:alpha-mannosidase